MSVLRSTVNEVEIAQLLYVPKIGSAMIGRPAVRFGELYEKLCTE